MTLALIFAILNAARGRKWLWLWAEEVNGRTRKRGNDWVWATICGLIATIAPPPAPENGAARAAHHQPEVTVVPLESEIDV